MFGDSIEDKRANRKQVTHPSQIKPFPSGHMIFDYTNKKTPSNTLKLNQLPFNLSQVGFPINTYIPIYKDCLILQFEWIHQKIGYQFTHTRNDTIGISAKNNRYDSPRIYVLPMAEQVYLYFGFHQGHIQAILMIEIKEQHYYTLFDDLTSDYLENPPQSVLPIFEDRWKMAPLQPQQHEPSKINHE